MQHTEKCLADREKERTELAAYEARWPRYCRYCGGNGLVSDRENAAPHGSGEVWLMDVSEPCPHCIEQGICPRCGSISNNFEDDDVVKWHCATCDWSEGMSGVPEVLNPYECGCYDLDVVQ